MKTTILLIIAVLLSGAFFLAHAADDVAGAAQAGESPAATAPASSLD